MILVENVGLGFPVEMNDIDKSIKEVDIKDSIKQAIYIILNTQKGERIMNPEFGSRIKEFVFEPQSPATNELLRHEIIRSLVRWEQRIEDIEVTFTNEDGKLFVTIRYHIIDMATQDQVDMTILSEQP